DGVGLPELRPKLVVIPELLEKPADVSVDLLIVFEYGHLSSSLWFAPRARAYGEVILPSRALGSFGCDEVGLSGRGPKMLRQSATSPTIVKTIGHPAIVWRVMKPRNPTCSACSP